MRTLWFVNPKNNERWNLAHMNPNSILGGCITTGLSGFGASTKITKIQVGVDYIVTEILSKSKNIKFTMLFKNYKHLESFTKFYASLKNELELHYDPKGEIKYSDKTSASWYRKVLISDIESSGEYSSDGWIHLSITLEVLSDVWYKNVAILASTVETDTNVLTYPIFQNYFYEGQNRLSLTISNPGLEVGCRIRIKNTSSSAMSTLEWHAIHRYINFNDEESTEYQKARFNVYLYPGYELIVDSTPIKQSAIVNFNNQTVNVAHYQEADWEYINFIQLSTGDTNLIFLVDNTEIEVEVEYTLASELAY